MKTPSPVVLFSVLLVAAGACRATGQTVVPLYSADPAASSSERARPRPDPAANASAALNNGGNPAAAIGAAQAASRSSVNQAPLIMGRAGTIGVNGDIGNAAAASSVNGVDTVSTPDFESIGMRRARRDAGLASGTADVAQPAVTAAPPPERAIARETGSAETVAAAIRASAVAARDAIVARVEDEVQERTRRLAIAQNRAADAQLQRALENARAAEDRLHERLQSARRATAAEWADVRAVLAADYEAYARATAAVERLAR